MPPGSALTAALTSQAAHIAFQPPTQTGVIQVGRLCRLTKPVMEFLRSKFGDRIISRKSEHHWPPYSPDLSCLDFSVWSEIMAHVFRCEPQTIAQLMVCGRGGRGLHPKHG
ncbi:hypothetical protein FJT64_011478 [Amphibalanus amphitrite]|uniref:Uncharacterized protein n=1 Tax=Amphibalanus amphitrite TaxID=1232801 RepID=A0A6A4V6N4_AMPAM|nr:hypothetical protein FJT64_011478 [Amphibalanus amphitrite]